MSMFEKASKQKLRFATVMGNLSTEDLWDLPLTHPTCSLDSIAKAMNKELKTNDEESFVEEKSSANTVLNLKFDIIKHVIEVKLKNKETAEKRAATLAKKDQILGIIARKQDEALEGKSEDELKELLEEL